MEFTKEQLSNLMRKHTEKEVSHIYPSIILYNIINIHQPL